VASIVNLGWNNLAKNKQACVCHVSAYWYASNSLDMRWQNARVKHHYNTTLNQMSSNQPFSRQETGNRSSDACKESPGVSLALTWFY
jgi:hypothetical protein